MRGSGAGNTQSGGGPKGKDTAGTVTPLRPRRRLTEQAARRDRLEKDLGEVLETLQMWKAGWVDLDEAAYLAHRRVGRVVGDLCREGGLT